MVFPKELTGNIKAEALPFTLGCPQGDLACMGAFQTYKRGQLTIKIRLALMDIDQYTNHIEINCPNRSLHVHPQRVASTSSFITLIVLACCCHLYFTDFRLFNSPHVLGTYGFDDVKAFVQDWYLLGHQSLVKDHG